LHRFAHNPTTASFNAIPISRLLGGFDMTTKASFASGIVYDLGVILLLFEV